MSVQLTLKRRTLVSVLQHLHGLSLPNQDINLTVLLPQRLPHAARIAV